ncbi:MAG: TadE/TadG family type IV pilus assembly protein [Gammaproteobacteria bacterium]
MLATNLSSTAPTLHARRNGGAYAVEFALVLMLFMLLVFGAIELARLIYLFNTAAEVTRRAAQNAAVTDFRYGGRLREVAQRAVFRTSPGELPFGAPVTDRHVVIDYLALTRNGSGALTMTPIPKSAMPSCPARNRQVCSLDPNDASCIRFVRARICQPGAQDCGAVPYQTLVPLVRLPLNVPASTTIVPAQSLGFTLGSSPCT